MAYQFNPLTGNLDLVGEGTGEGQATDLSYDAATRTLSSSTGSDVVLPEATTSLAGLMSSADKVKVNSIAPTDLSYDAASRTLSSSTGSDVVLPEATNSLPGLMSSADKVKVNSIVTVGLAAGLAIALG